MVECVYYIRLLACLLFTLSLGDLDGGANQLRGHMHMHMHSQMPARLVCYYRALNACSDACDLGHTRMRVDGLHTAQTVAVAPSAPVLISS